MARIRSVKPEFWTDRKLARLSRDARLLYIALWNQADEHGRVHGDSRYIKGHCLPYDDDLTLVAVERLVDELALAGRVVRYEHDGDPFLYLPRLAKHQRLEAAKVPSRLPEPPRSLDDPTPDPDEDQRSGDQDAPDLGEAASRANKSAPRADESGTTVALQVAGGREQVAGTPTPAEPPRADVEAVCARLVERLVANGCKAPTITAKWRTEARLLLDRDQRPLDEVFALIDWCQADSFWRSNVQSLETFRKQYDRLRLKSQEPRSTVADRMAVGYGDDSRSLPARTMTADEWMNEGRSASGGTR